MAPSLPLLSCESSVSVKENPDRKKKTGWSGLYFYSYVVKVTDDVIAKKYIYLYFKTKL